MTKRFYCALCWQEFDNPQEHNAGSWFGRERLDKDCAGDIRIAEGRVVKSRAGRGEAEPLQFPDEGIVIN